jgi:tRNA pseudouridine55 synthase
MPVGAGSGVLSVNKPAGPSSRRIVDQLIRVLGTRRVGHAGSLDPFARGLLLIVWGRATGLVPYLLEYPKHYLARVRFGQVTDTQDRTGAVLEERDASSLTTDAVREMLPRFRGRVAQIPPMYSALKHEGRRLYAIARDGEQVVRAAREQVVDRFELVEWDPPFAGFEVICSRGTYVRTLAHDLGEAVGVGAHVDDLVRTAIGPYALDDAVSATDIPSMDEDGVRRYARDPVEALPDWPAITVPAEEARSVTHGAWRDPERRAVETRGYRVVDEKGALLALARGGPEVKLLRVFAETEAR